jgi:phosphate starvation-inducible protein PhoH and related proteins
MSAKQQRKAALLEKAGRRRNDPQREQALADQSIPAVSRAALPLQAKTGAQRELIRSVHENTVTVAHGPAGTGKTYVFGAMAADALRDKRVRKLYITRPAVEAGESLGFLPGDLDEKFEPYFRPFRDVLYERMGRSFAEAEIRSGKVEAIPLAYMRGMTFKDCIVILDEAQNTTPTQMKLLLTRVGENCKLLINGDTGQVDITGKSGLADALEKLQGMGNVGIVRFGTNDIVRSGFVQEVIRRYEGTA